MSILTSGLPKEDRLGNPIYSDYRNMVMVEALFKDTDEQGAAAWGEALQWLYGEDIPPHGNIQDWLYELVWFYSGGKENDKENEKGAELISFEQDAEYIHADFLTAYGIDIAETDLHWWKFLSLLKALPEDMTMSKRMYYRGVPLSKFKGEERKNIAQIKKEIAIKKPHSVTYKTAEDKAKAYRERLQKRAQEALQNVCRDDNMKT